MEMRVVAYRGGLNLRSAPERDAPNIIGQFSFLQRIEVNAEDQENGFVHCSGTTTAGQEIEGYVSGKLVRPLLSTQREALLDQVFMEHERFRHGLGKEHLPPFSKYVGEMWRALKIPLDGTDRDQPWSAAAISFMVRRARDAYANFAFSQSHSKFTHAAIQAGKKRDPKAPFWGYDLYEKKPSPCDIVVRDNPDIAPTVDFHYASENRSYRSHSDIIVHIDSEAQKAIAIGGNVGHSVAITEYDLAPGDYLAATRHTFALLVNRADEIGP